MAELVVEQDVDAAAPDVWAAMTDWSLHGEWMLLTRAEGGSGEGASIAAFTGLGRLGILDTMTITVWEPPHRCVVRHTGRVIRGSGALQVKTLTARRSRVVWSEWFDLPLGRLGRIGWPLARPLVRAALTLSLRRLARYVEGNR